MDGRLHRACCAHTRHVGQFIGGLRGTDPFGRIHGAGHVSALAQHACDNYVAQKDSGNYIAELSLTERLCGPLEAVAKAEVTEYKDTIVHAERDRARKLVLVCGTY